MNPATLRDLAYLQQNHATIYRAILRLKAAEERALARRGRYLEASQPAEPE